MGFALGKNRAHDGIEFVVGNPFTSYSAQARILPYIEQANLYQLVDLNAAYTSQPTVTQQRVALYLCPSEVRDQAKAGTPASGNNSTKRERR